MRLVGASRRAVLLHTMAESCLIGLTGSILGVVLIDCRKQMVYSWCMATVRTNIEIEDSFVQTIMDRYGVRTKREAVDLALRHLAGQPMTRERALAMRGANAIAGVPEEVPPRGEA